MHGDRESSHAQRAVSGAASVGGDLISDRAAPDPGTPRHDGEPRAVAGCGPYAAGASGDGDRSRASRVLDVNREGADVVGRTDPVLRDRRGLAGDRHAAAARRAAVGRGADGDAAIAGAARASSHGQPTGRARGRPRATGSRSYRDCRRGGADWNGRRLRTDRKGADWRGRGLSECRSLPADGGRADPTCARVRRE